ncbi:MAG TPA: MauE/DoxX family redox-associated membrane protein [Verrucomicrobiae bacterium]|nr:MauE/DoxX family redox-associated membrane protein [Verrucomicrobiae bacterium]
MRFIRPFLIIAGVLLLVTALAKLISSTGNARILREIDPILSVSFQKVSWIVGVLELVVSLICLFGKRVNLQTVLVAWLATSFVIYRLGLLWIGYHKPCSCMGNLTDALHLSPQTTSTAMKIILAYLLIGSYGAFFWLWLHKLKTPLSKTFRKKTAFVT